MVGCIKYIELLVTVVAKEVVVCGEIPYARRLLAVWNTSSRFLVRPSVSVEVPLLFINIFFY